MNRIADFSPRTKEILAKRVGYMCSNPTCKRPTVGPNSAIEKSTTIGIAAHITAASPAGPRYKSNLSLEERKHITNGIWLCSLCSDLIDKDERHYTVELLNDWKREAEQAQLERLKGVKYGSGVVKYTGSIIIDIGKVNNPNQYLSIGEVRFSVTNASTKPIKITSLGLKILHREFIMSTVAAVPAAPIDEYYLYVRIDESTVYFELTDKHFELFPEKTEGFFLKVDGIEGQKYILQLQASWHIMGEDFLSSEFSNPFSLKFNSRSPEALLRLLDRIKK
ncbi:hypothetical protein [Dinghuibacter silviterrae]|uniref:HNH endonuclease n=1 Tax=Dinghuibacter silviterrae TaxID=1539049 RepID=A0A4R8DNT8_9BACT|nr:hypothetical protein [Dinghuibacter silviterrae]TDW99739.1 hypothetical protein EDB95_0750 [Dinghuibacter silviterrae]